MCENQPNTLPDPLLTPIYARREKHEQKRIDTMGRPFFNVFMKIFGAFPAIARPSVRLLNQYKLNRTISLVAHIKHGNLCIDHSMQQTTRRLTSKR
jgi:hypothetical protein